MPPESNPPEAPVLRDRIFISYSSQDKPWLDKLMKHLKPLFPASGEHLRIWADSEIQAGSEWSKEIQAALDTSCAAVLLVSPDFLVSRFIMEVEWPHLRDAAATRDLKIFWLPVRPSVVDVTDIRHYQCLHKPLRALSEFPEAEQEALLAKDCKLIKTKTELITPKPVPGRLQPPIRRFEVNMPDLGPCGTDSAGRFWVSNGRQVKLFQIGRSDFIDRWQLPNRRWKAWLPELWQDQLLFADWDGALHRFKDRRGSGAAPLHPAGPLDLPIHRLAVGGDGRLVTAAWNGRIRVWDSRAQPVEALSKIVVPHLPIHLLPLADGGLAVVDQSQHLRIYESSGRPAWQWLAPEPIEALWPAQDGSKSGFVLQCGWQSLVKVSGAGVQTGLLRFSKPIRAVSRRTAPDHDGWTVVASAGGEVDWVSDSSFECDPGYRVTLEAEVRSLHALFNPDQPARLIALGLTTAGELFHLDEDRGSLVVTEEKYQRLVLDRTGRFLFLQAGGNVSLFRNPAFPEAACQIEVARVEGTLVVGSLTRIQIFLKNTGPIAILELEAQLTSADDHIDPSRISRPPPLPLRANETAPVEFSVRARVPGELPLLLALKIMDEGGSKLSVPALNCVVPAQVR